MGRLCTPKENTKGWERSAFSSRLGERGRRKTSLFLLLRERESALSLWGLRERETAIVTSLSLCHDRATVRQGSFSPERDREKQLALTCWGASESSSCLFIGREIFRFLFSPSEQEKDRQLSLPREIERALYSERRREASSFRPLGESLKSKKHKPCQRICSLHFALSEKG